MPFRTFQTKSVKFDLFQAEYVHV